jgi:hypothetical protein
LNHDQPGSGHDAAATPWPDATHLATAVSAGADRFITDSQRDFPRAITEVDVTYPADLADPGT